MNAIRKSACMCVWVECPFIILFFVNLYRAKPTAKELRSLRVPRNRVGIPPRVAANIRVICNTLGINVEDS